MWRRRQRPACPSWAESRPILRSLRPRRHCPRAARFHHRGEQSAKKTIKNRIPERAYLQPRAEVSGVVSVVVVVLSDVLG